MSTQSPPRPPAKLTWYKRYPEDALTGMMALSPDERGCYNTVLDLIYLHANRLADDDRFIAGWCACDVRVWRRIKARLLDLHKLYVEDGFIKNAKADREVDEAIARHLAATDAAHHRWIIKPPKSERQSSKNKDLFDATANATAHAGANADSGLRTQKEKNPLPPTEIDAKKRDPNRPARTIPDDAMQTAVARYNAAAARHGWPLVQPPINADRRQKLATRLAAHGIAGWNAMMNRAETSEFLTGKTGRSNGHEHWKPSFDFFVRSSSFTKTFEGGFGGNPDIDPPDNSKPKREKPAFNA